MCKNQFPGTIESRDDLQRNFRKKKISIEQIACILCLSRKFFIIIDEIDEMKTMTEEGNSVSPSEECRT